MVHSSSSVEGTPIGDPDAIPAICLGGWVVGRQIAAENSSTAAMGQRGDTSR
jgi:hypothetical protein